MAQTVSLSNSGGGTLTWSAMAGAAWINLSPSSGTAPATLSISVEPRNMAPGTYTSTVHITATGATASPVSVTITLVVSGSLPVGVITGVANAASYQPSFASGTWVAIFGKSLSEITRLWQSSDFGNGQLPTSLSNVSVTIDGKPAYIEYIGPSQINVLAPDDATVGPVEVQVTTAGQVSNSVTAQKQQFAPAFFTVSAVTYVAAVHLDGTLVSKSNPAKPGEVIEVYGTGFGPTNPPLESGALVTKPEPLANAVTVTIGGQTAAVGFQGVVESGLVQLNVAVPKLPAGDAAIVAQVGGVQTQPGVLITVGQ